MAESILHYRETLPNQLKQTFASLLLAQRPPIPPVVDDAFLPPSQTALPGTLIAARAPNPGVEDNLKSSKVALLGEEDPETAEKIRLLKFKIASNVSIMPVVLKRMNDCISMIDKLDTGYANIHPAFKRKRTY
ncbi:hypothetical protein BVC80_8729g16 [Macleaya cordata]|uniref:Uncharacterized protein n=1 Tax=Macleaya cordata TaxID=56857 RepID=A0A200Q8F9_MACCD|nr:hypothetical protein BVC80_8729g16 [Macleaya cordata]